MSGQDLERVLKEQRNTQKEVQEVHSALRELRESLPAGESYLSLEKRLEEIAHNLRERITHIDNALLRIENRLEGEQRASPAASLPQEVQGESLTFEERYEQAQDFSVFNDIDLRIDELKDFLDLRTARWRLQENVFYGVVILLLLLTLLFSWWAAFLR